jgi:hypothetical protein
VQSEIGQELARFLVEFLPYEEEPLSMLISTRLVLQAGLISDDDVMKLWKKAKSKNTLYVGFLDVRADNMPEPIAAHSRYNELQTALSDQLKNENPYALMLSKLLSASGQSFLNTAEASFKRISNYDVAGGLIEAIRRYVFVRHVEAGEDMHSLSLGLNPGGEVQTDINEILLWVDNLYHEKQGMSCTDELKAIQSTIPEFSTHIQAMLNLSRISQTVLAPTIAKSTAMGTLMRKKLKPVFDPILMNLRILQN